MLSISGRRPLHSCQQLPWTCWPSLEASGWGAVGPRCTCNGQRGKQGHPSFFRSPMPPSPLQLAKMKTRSPFLFPQSNATITTVPATGKEENKVILPFSAVQCHYHHSTCNGQRGKQGHPSFFRTPMPPSPLYLQQAKRKTRSFFLFPQSNATITTVPATGKEENKVTLPFSTVQCHHTEWPITFFTARSTVCLKAATGCFVGPGLASRTVMHWACLDNVLQHAGTSTAWTLTYMQQVLFPEARQETAMVSTSWSCCSLQRNFLKEFTHSNPYAHARQHPKRSAYTKPMLRMGESANSEMHSMLNSCCTWAPPSTDDSTGLGCVDSCHHS